MNSNVLYISKNDLDKIGSSTIIGKCFASGFQQNVPLTIKIETSSRNWRANNNGPDYVLISEFVIPCLLDDVVNMIANGWNIKIEFDY